MFHEPYIFNNDLKYLYALCHQFILQSKLCFYEQLKWQIVAHMHNFSILLSFFWRHYFNLQGQSTVKLPTGRICFELFRKLENTNLSMVFVDLGH